MIHNEALNTALHLSTYSSVCLSAEVESEIWPYTAENGRR